jgi:hypothetical protein
MRALVLGLVIVVTLASGAWAGHRGGGGGHSSGGRSHTAATGTGSSHSSHSVKGYTTKRGTYVAPHRQSNSDSTQRNNWSTKGNTNPSTGRAGTKTARH